MIFELGNDLALPQKVSFAIADMALDVGEVIGNKLTVHGHIITSLRPNRPECGHDLQHDVRASSRIGLATLARSQITTVICQLGNDLSLAHKVMLALGYVHLGF